MGNTHEAVTDGRIREVSITRNGTKRHKNSNAIEFEIRPLG